ncbi:MAG TPA: 8-amino-7-oxononanoate synthase [Sphingomicrobium sp.]|nr:8-amino-7-oxononanoate synthase [Sphingomicrobium sp.]
MSNTDYHEQLEELDRRGRLRRLTVGQGLDFASNDYLALTRSSELRAAVVEALMSGVPIGSGGSRLLRGNHAQHELLEQEFARFVGSQSALLFSSGFAANCAVLSTLPQRGDLILYDELVHASSHEGIRLARAGARSARHNDLTHLSDQLRQWRNEGALGRPWIVVESLYSMDGDRAPLAELAAIADRHEAFLVIDEAHATGVFGRQGRGLAEGLEGRDNVITVRTLGKALACEGALVCASAVIRDFLINRGRGFIFSTAPSPLISVAARAALGILQSDQERQARLHQLFAFAQRCLEPLGARCHGTQIIPLVIGDEGRTLALATRLQELGFDVRAIRPPTVPDGTSRLRIAITLNVDQTQISEFSDALRNALS